MLKKTFPLAIFLLLILPIFPVVAQKVESPISVERIEEALKEGSLPLGRIAAIVREGGVNFELTTEVRERLKRAGADVVVLQAVERAAVEYAKRKVEEETKRRDEEKRGSVEPRSRTLSLEDVEELLKAGLSQVRISLLIEDRGVDFELTEQITLKLRSLGAENKMLQTLEKVARRKGVGEDGAEMVLIPAGEFWMGSEDGDAGANEKPRRRVYLDTFQIDKYEVTNALYRRFMEARGWALPGYWDNSNFNGPTQPVVGVSWFDTEAYCKWAGKRLPTEAEWEKAARGTDGRRYPWGNDWDASKTNSGESKIGKTVPVGSYPSGVSPYGVHDMGGNVWEWVTDWYDADYYRRAPNRNPKGPDSGQLRVLRGGSWDYIARGLLRAANRDGYAPTNQYYGLGFRCAQ